MDIRSAFDVHFAAQLIRSSLADRWQTTPPTNVSAKLRSIVEFARTYSPYYCERIPSMPKSGTFTLANVPLLEKSALVSRFDEIVTERRIRSAELEEYFRAPFAFERRFKEKYLAFHTSGSTGRPAYLVWGPREFGISTAAYLVSIARSFGNRSMWSAIRELRTSAAYIGILDDYIGGNSWAHAMTRFTKLRMMSVFEARTELLRALDQTQPGLIMTKPTVLGELARHQMAGELHIAPKRLVFAGERISPQDKADIQSAFGQVPHNSYSMCETGPIAFQSDVSQDSLDIMDELVHVELLDEKDAPIEEPNIPGQVVVTNLYNRLMPIIRYRTGDVATFVTTPKGGRKLSYIVGRNTSQFQFGAAVSERFSVPEYPFWSIHVPGVLRYQVIQESPIELHIRVQWHPHADRTSAEAQMRAKIDRVLGDGDRRRMVSVRIDPVTEIPLNRAGKVQITFPLGRTPSNRIES